MSNESILMMIVIGGVVGWLAGLVMRGSGYGIVGDIVVGLLVLSIGNWLCAHSTGSATGWRRT
jgi:uncharacterized membrane protein YeaQ/YmgE (transglycosylase-associated protein family)